jgi:serine/threonine protein kinase/Tol biopolymer transport system component
MKPDRWQRVKQIFQAAMDRAPAERAVFVSDACAGDEELRQEVESLMSSDGRSGTFLDSPAYEAAAEMIVEDKSGLKKGRTIGPFEILSFISRGGMGEVYLAHDPRLSRKVALKVLPESFTKDDDRLRRFEQEARAASALNHPNIITIYEILKTGATHVIAAEFVEGETLRQHLSRSQPTLSESLQIAIQVADALAAAHKVGIIHRDIKPENIMLRPDGYVKVLDFGLAKLAEESPGVPFEEALTKQVRTGSGVIMGTAGYMSPEQARGKTVDARTDIFSLGAVIYELVTHRKPFDGETPSDVMAAILKTEPKPLTESIADAPPELSRIVMKALRKDPEQRYQSVKDLLIDLRALKQDLEFQEKMGSRAPAPVLQTAIASASATSTSSTGEVRSALSTITDSLTIEIKRHRIATALSAIVLLLVLSAGAYGLYRYFRHTPVHFQTTKVTRLTNSGKVIDATLTPDGRYVVYTLSDARKQSIWIRQVSTANDKVIVPPADVGVFGITISRDNNDLYYVIKQQLDKGTLYRVPVFGGTPTKITEWLDGPVTLSPDGKRMAFVRGSFPAEGESALVVANIDGSGEQVLARRKRPQAFAPIFFTGPTWSPDGELIAAAVADATGPSHVIAFRVSNGKETDLTPSGQPFIARTLWLPDSSGLLMIGGNSAADSQVWLVPYPTGILRQITNDLEQHRDLGLSETADKFVTVVSSGLVNVWVAPNGEADKATQVPVGNLSFYGSWGNTVGWTPDGRIVFASNESSAVDLWIMDADGSNRKQLTSNAGKNTAPVVSSDGRYIVFSSTRGGAGAVWRMNIDGSSPRQLSQGKGESSPAISPDGKWVLYARVGAAKPTVWKVSIDGGEGVELTSKVAFNPMVSPDGKLVAYIYADSYDAFAPPNRIAIIPFEGGEPTKTLSFREGSRTQTLAQWSPDGKAIYYSSTINNVTNIWSQSVDGGEPKQITQFKDGLMNGFAWTRDGKALVCTRGTSTRDAVLISDVGN